VCAALLWLAVAALAHAQTSPTPAPAAQDVPRFEIRRFVFEGATLIPPAELEHRTRTFTGPMRSFADVQRALEAVERAYSEAGYNAVQVVLPEQELERGEVRFRVVEARVGRVQVEGNKFFDEANIRASVPAIAPGAAPNITRIARNLNLANENPAKKATVLLRSGEREGSVDAVVRVADEDWLKFAVTLDNSGTRKPAACGWASGCRTRTCSDATTCSTCGTWERRTPSRRTTRVSRTSCRSSRPTGC